MFHRVKSETAAKPANNIADQTVDTDVLEAPVQQAQAASHTAARAQNATTISAQQSQTSIEEKLGFTVSKQKQEENVEEIQEEAVEAATEGKQNASPAQGLYQRATPSSYSPAPRAAAFAAPKAPNAAADNGQTDRRLTIGRGITMSGEIESCDELQVEGTVEAALKGSKLLNISETGVFYGTVEIEDAVIAGRFEGEIIANGRITIEETGVVTGSITYKELEISSGAVIDGRLTPISAGPSKKGE